MDQKRSVNLDQRWGAILSVLLHVALLVLGGLFLRQPASTEIVAAGEGSGEGGGMIEVGVVDAGQLGLSARRAVSLPGEERDLPNNELVETQRPDPSDEAEVLPTDQPRERRPTDPTVRQVDRPTPRQTEQLVTQTPQRGLSPNTNVEVGRSSGSPVPSMTGGIGVGSGAGRGEGGLPGGSEYGRRIQLILSRNYNPPAVSTPGTEYVIVELRIARDGRILSLTGGRLDPRSLKRRSPLDLVNYAAERAVIASNPLPPFPNGFLLGSQEATAEIWFRYPK
ncbi:MAG: TonB C-terminal domain-containing protein [Blastocatellia bacterium]